MILLGRNVAQRRLTKKNINAICFSQREAQAALPDRVNTKLTIKYYLLFPEHCYSNTKRPI